jgi:hypothetical protein
MNRAMGDAFDPMVVDSVSDPGSCARNRTSHGS